MLAGCGAQDRGDSGRKMPSVSLTGTNVKKWWRLSSARPLVFVAVIALAGAFVAFWVVAHPAHQTAPRQVGGRWYADDAPDTLQPNGTDAGERVDITGSDRFWKSQQDFVGRRVVLIGRVQVMDAESSRSMVLDSIDGRGSAVCYWSPSEDASFGPLQKEQTVRLSGIARIHWNPEHAQGFHWASPASPALEACRIEQ
jgi:hypothetical protein